MNDSLILKVLADTFDVDVEDCTTNTCLNELGDSLDAAEFSFALEKEIGVRIDMTKFPMTGTIYDLLLFVEQQSFDFQNGARKI